MDEKTEIKVEAPKKAATKKVSAKPKTLETATKREKELVLSLLTYDSKAVKSMIKRFVGIPMSDSNFPTNVDEVDQMIRLMESYPYIKLESMKGWCKIWDAIIADWDNIKLMSESDNRRELRDLIRAIASKYCTNQTTGNYQSSLYGQDT